MDKFTVVRHLRPEQLTITYPDNIGGLMEAQTELHNLGGITFLFELSYASRNGPCTVRYSYALCRKNENFNKSKGTTIATEKLAANVAIELYNYDPSESLVVNLLLDLEEKAANKDPIFTQQKLYRLYSYIKKIIRDNAKNQDDLDDLEYA